MNQRNPNRIMWYSLVLLLALCAGFLAVSTGTAYARYRTELREDVTFEVRQPEQICLGTVDDKNAFSTEAPAWKTVGDVTQMQLALANGTSDTECSWMDQKAFVCLVSGPGLWDGASAAKITLTQPDGSTIQAKATVIAEDTPLYHTYGAGWVYRFYDAEGEELSWELDGGKLSFVSLTVTVEAEQILTDTLLRILVTGQLSEE